MAKRAHPAEDILTEDARLTLHDGFRRKLTYRAIAAELKSIGQPLPERNIARCYSRWNAEVRRLRMIRENADALVAAALDRKVGAADQVVALVQDGLARNPDQPITVEEMLKAEKLRLDREKHELNRDKHDLSVKKDKDRLASIAAAAADLEKGRAKGGGIDEDRWVEFLKFQGLNPEKFKK